MTDDLEKRLETQGKELYAQEKRLKEYLKEEKRLRSKQRKEKINFIVSKSCKFYHNKNLGNKLSAAGIISAGILACISFVEIAQPGSIIERRAPTKKEKIVEVSNLKNNQTLEQKVNEEKIVIKEEPKKETSDPTLKENLTYPTKLLNQYEQILDKFNSSIEKKDITSIRESIKYNKSFKRLIKNFEFYKTDKEKDINFYNNLKLVDKKQSKKIRYNLSIFYKKGLVKTLDKIKDNYNKDSVIGMIENETILRKIMNVYYQLNLQKKENKIFYENVREKYDFYHDLLKRKAEKEFISNQSKSNSILRGFRNRNYSLEERKKNRKNYLLKYVEESKNPLFNYLNIDELVDKEFKVKESSVKPEVKKNSGLYKIEPYKTIQNIERVKTSEEGSNYTWARPTGKLSELSEKAIKQEDSDIYKYTIGLGSKIVTGLVNGVTDPLYEATGTGYSKFAENKFFLRDNLEEVYDFSFNNVEEFAVSLDKQVGIFEYKEKGKINIYLYDPNKKHKIAKLSNSINEEVEFQVGKNDIGIIYADPINKGKYLESRFRSSDLRKYLDKNLLYNVK